MFRVELTIADKNYSKYVVYPITLSEKDIDDSLNLYEFELKHTPITKPFKPNREIFLRIYENNILKKQLYLILVNDVVEKHGRRNLYSHSITAIEYTSFLEKRILPDMTLTRISSGPETFIPTLKDAAERVLFVAGLRDITLAGSTAALLDSQESPE